MTLPLHDVMSRHVRCDIETLLGRFQALTDYFRLVFLCLRNVIGERHVTLILLRPPCCLDDSPLPSTFDRFAIVS